MENYISQSFNRQKRSDYRKSLAVFLLIFQFLGITLSILYNELLSNRSIILSLVFIGLTFLTNIYYTKKLKGDSTFIYLINLLYSISVIIILRLDASLIEKHLIWYVSGIIVFTIVRYLIKYLNKFLQDKFYLFFVITLLTFIFTLVFGYTEGGAKNWISIGGLFSLQLSEFAKISFIFMIASYYENIEKFKEKKFGKYYLVISTYLFSGLFFLQGELGTAMIFFALFISAMFIFERRYLFIILNILLGIVGIYLASLFLAHIKVRIDIWLNPWADFNGRGYQIIQSLYSIANGGFFGTGIGLGNPELVPVIQTDFILTAIIEEMGLFMGFAIILIFILIFYKAIKISLQFKSRFMSSIALSIGLLYSVQTLIMLGGIMNLIPLTGITTPFLSYGGSSTLSSFILLAVLQYLSSKTGEEYE